MLRKGIIGLLGMLRTGIIGLFILFIINWLLGLENELKVGICGCGVWWFAAPGPAPEVLKANQKASRRKNVTILFCTMNELWLKTSGPEG